MPKIILATENAKHFNLSTGKMNIGRFPGGEVSLSIKENLVGGDVFIVGSTDAPAENLLEMIFAVDTARKLGAASITVVIPYFGYSRADREKFQGDSVSSEAVAKMLEAVGGKDFKVVSINTHSELVSKFFKVPFVELDATDLFTEKFREASGLTVVAPDKGAEVKAREFARKVGADKIAVIDKERAEDGTVTVKGIIGEVGQKALLVDDIIDSGATLLKASEFLRQKGVTSVSLAAVHMVWRGGGYKILADENIIENIYTTDTIMPPDSVPEKIEIISVLPVLQEFING